MSLEHSPANLRNRPPAKRHLLSITRIIHVLCALGLLAAWVLYLLATFYPQSIDASIESASYIHLRLMWIAYLAFSLKAHLAIGVSIAFLGFFVLRKWWWLAWSAMLIAFSGVPILIYQYSSQPPPQLAEPTLKVLSVNVLAYNYKITPIAETVKSIDPDIVVLQEFSPQWNKWLPGALRATHPHQFLNPRGGAWGAAIFSKHPFKQQQVIPFSEDPGMVVHQRIVISFHDQDIAIHNVHLLNPMSPFGFKQSRLHLAEFLGHIRAEKLPAVLAGDFNAVPSSTPIKEILALGYHSAHTFTRPKPWTTWTPTLPVPHVPGLILDHILTSKTLIPTKLQAHDAMGSDHRMILATIGFPKP